MVRLLLPCSLAFLAAACCDKGGARSLIDHAKWADVPESEDPFISRKPAEAPCEPGSAIAEDFNGEPSFTVQSMGCTYLTVAQTCLTGTCPGEQLHLRLWHFNLTNIDGASEAYVAMRIDGKTVFEQTVAIPSPSELIRPYIPLDTELAEGM